MRKLLLVAPLLPLLLLASATARGAEKASTSCLICHSDPDMVGDEAAAISESTQHDVHVDVGLSCHDCHGGNPDPALAEDMFAAMDPDHAANPYLGPPARTQIPGFCGRCHSDPKYMKRFNPSARVDQEREYWTSQHGELLAAGDEAVATCIDCHGVHGILRSGDTHSPIYPTHLAETCNSCHGDPEHMAGYTLEGGRPLPVDQYAKWRRSVHATALLEKEDLSAPTCNDCHGNHGAQPPGLESVAFVCGQCHGREAGLFRQSPIHEGFKDHDEVFLPEMGPDGCIECHEPPAPQARITGVRSFYECTACHGNHGIVRPRVTMLAPPSETPCALCHEEAGPLSADFPEPEKQRKSYEAARDELVTQARAAGLEGDDLFDWMVDAAQTLSHHTHRVGGEEGAELALRPEFGRLFDKFRIGKTYYTYVDPAAGETVRQPLVRCTDCHGDEGSRGLTTARELLARQQDLTVLTARADRILLAARRGGVEVGEATLALDHAIDAEIELQVLVHAFSSEPGSEFAKKHEDGLERARAAIEAGREALKELTFRRQGLAVSLIVIVLVLIGLGVKIRHLSRETDLEERASG